MEVEVDGYMEVEVQVDTCSLVYSHQLQIGQRLRRSSVTSTSTFLSELIKPGLVQSILSSHLIQANLV